MSAIPPPTSSEKLALDNLNAFVEVISEALQAGEKVTVDALGSFGKIVKPERVGRMPGTDEPLVFPASYSPCFDAATELKKRLNKP